MSRILPEGTKVLVDIKKTKGDWPSEEKQDGLEPGIIITSNGTKHLAGLTRGRHYIRFPNWSVDYGGWYVDVDAVSPAEVPELETYE